MTAAERLDRIEERLARRTLDPVGWAQSAPSDQGWLLALARRLLGGCAPGGGVTDCAQDEAPGTAT